MRVLLVYPNTSGSGEIPINLSLLQACLKRHNHQVDIFDLTHYLERQDKEVAVKLGQFKKAPPPPFPKPTRARENLVTDLLEKVGKFKPDLVGITSMTTDFPEGLRCARVVKQAGDIPIIYGGVHATILPHQVIENEEIDIVCVGEGEGPLVELCDNLQSGKDISHIPNLWVKTKDGIVRNEIRPLVDLDGLPPQDFSGFEEYDYYRPLAGELYRMVNVQVARGCPFLCSYCVNHYYQKMSRGKGRYFRKKSIEKAIAELCYYKETHRVDLVRFWDEDFTSLDVHWLGDFAAEYKRRVGLPFLVYARVETVTREKLRILKDMGCVTIGMGVESGSPWIRRYVLNRRTKDDKIVGSFGLVHEFGIRVSAYNMMGLPFETRSDIFQTIELNRKCKTATSSVSFLEPYPNTEIYDLCARFGFIDPGYIPKYGLMKPHIKSLYISHRELRGLFKTFSMYIKVPKMLFPIMRLCENDGFFSDILLRIMVSLFAR